MRMDLSGNIKERIADIIDKAKGDVHMPDQVKDLLTKICYEMYKAGLKDGHKTCIMCLEESKKMISA